MHFNICCACFGAIKTHFLFGRHVVVLFPCSHRAVVLLPAPLWNGVIYLAYLPAFPRLLCDTLTNKAEGVENFEGADFYEEPGISLGFALGQQIAFEHAPPFCATPSNQTAQNSYSVVWIAVPTCEFHSVHLMLPDVFHVVSLH